MAEAVGDIFGPINFETGDMSQFTSTTENNSATIRADAGAKNNGYYGCKVTYDGAASYAFATKTFSDANATIWVRFYIYIPSTFSMLDGGYTRDLFFQFMDGASHVAYFGVRNAGGTVPTAWAMSWLTTYQNSTTNFSTNAWHRIEMKYVRSATVGGVELWVDGTKILQDVDQNTSAIYPDSIKIGEPFAYTCENGDYWYFDDLIGTTTQRGAYVEAPTNFTQNINDSITISENNIKQFLLSYSDSITISEYLSNGISLSQNDSVSLSDDITKLIKLFKAENVTISELVSKIIKIYKTDITTISDICKTPGGIRTLMYLYFSAKKSKINISAKKAKISVMSKNIEV